MLDCWWITSSICVFYLCRVTELCLEEIITSGQNFLKTFVFFCIKSYSFAVCLCPSVCLYQSVCLSPSVCLSLCHYYCDSFCSICLKMNCICYVSVDFIFWFVHFNRFNNPLELLSKDLPHGASSSGISDFPQTSCHLKDFEFAREELIKKQNLRFCSFCCFYSVVCF